MIVLSVNLSDGDPDPSSLKSVVIRLKYLSKKMKPPKYYKTTRTIN